VNVASTRGHKPERRRFCVGGWLPQQGMAMLYCAPPVKVLLSPHKGIE
jgi:hypothetical protein